MVEATGTTWTAVSDGSLQELERTLPAAVEPLLSRGVQHLLVTCGSLGAVLCSAQPAGIVGVDRFSFPGLQAHAAEFSVERRAWQVEGSRRGFLSYSVPALTAVESVTGAGDSLIAATAAAYGLRSAPLADAVLYGLAAARLCLASAENVSPHLSAEIVSPQRAA